MITVILFGLSLLADYITTQLAISAGAVETNALYGKNPNMTLLFLTHLGALLLAMLLLNYAPDLRPMIWGATGVMVAVAIWNIIVWRKQKRMKS